jgi:hypothetical protein
MSYPTNLDMSKAKKAFPKISGRMESPQGLAEILISMDHMCEVPKVYEPRGGLILYKSLSAQDL